MKTEIKNDLPNQIINVTFIPIMPTPAMRINVSGGKGLGAWVLHQTDEYLAEYDRKKLEETGVAGSALRKKRQFEKYTGFKDELAYWSRKNNFEMPYNNFKIVFKIPIGRSIRKPERLKRIGQEHTIRPDADNLLKACIDAYLKRKTMTYFDYDDAKTNSYFIKKIWVEAGEEGIEITKYNRIEI